MDIDLFRLYGHQLIDWIADYYQQIESYPVKPLVSPGEIKNQLPLSMPMNGESYDAIFADFVNILLPGITHWQHPNFHGYFPAKSFIKDNKLKRTNVLESCRVEQ